jgi:hypothetical protein
MFFDIVGAFSAGRPRWRELTSAFSDFRRLPVHNESESMERCDEKRRNVQPDRPQ